MKVKLFGFSLYTDELQDSINDFIAEEDVDVLDIKFNTDMVKEDRGWCVGYSAIVLYTKRAKKARLHNEKNIKLI